MGEYFLSKEQLDYVCKDSNTATILNEAREVRENGITSQGVTVFLSHKHDEVAVLANAICMLKSLGIFVYVDWMDEGMPKETCGETAQRIKQKIKECRKFILLATEGAIASKWCNWELGFGDAQKYPEHIAIMPITDKRRDNFSGSEYLQIYPVIKTSFEYIASGCYVEFEEKKIPLVDWLKR